MRPNHFSRKCYKAEWPDMLMRGEEALIARIRGLFVGLTTRELPRCKAVNLVDKRT